MVFSPDVLTRVVAFEEGWPPHVVHVQFSHHAFQNRTGPGLNPPPPAWLPVTATIVTAEGSYDIKARHDVPLSGVPEPQQAGEPSLEDHVLIYDRGWRYVEEVTRSATEDHPHGWIFFVDPLNTNYFSPTATEALESAWGYYPSAQAALDAGYSALYAALPWLASPFGPGIVLGATYISPPKGAVSRSVEESYAQRGLLRNLVPVPDDLLDPAQRETAEFDIVVTGDTGTSIAGSWTLFVTVSNLVTWGGNYSWVIVDPSTETGTVVNTINQHLKVRVNRKTGEMEITGGNQS